MPVSIEKSNSILPVFNFFFFFFFLILNWSRSTRPGSLVAPRYLYNGTILSRFSICFRREVEVASEASGTVNDVSSTLLGVVSGV